MIGVEDFRTSVVHVLLLQKSVAIVEARTKFCETSPTGDDPKEAEFLVPRHEGSRSAGSPTCETFEFKLGIYLANYLSIKDWLST